MAKPVLETFEEKFGGVEGLTEEQRRRLLIDDSDGEFSIHILSQDELPFLRSILKEFTKDTYRNRRLIIDVGLVPADSVNEASYGASRAIDVSKENIEDLTLFFETSDRAQQIMELYLTLNVEKDEKVDREDIYFLMKAVFALKNIEQLHLDFSCIDMDLFTENLKLADGCSIENLRLKGIKNIDEGFLGSLERAKNLLILELNESNLESLDFLDKIRGRLTKLFLISLNLKDYPEQLKDLSLFPLLKSISLYNNDINATVNIKVGNKRENLGDVTKIELSYNPLEDLVIEGDRNVEKIILKSCIFSNFPRDLFERSGLTLIDLKENLISSIPEGVSFANCGVSVDLRGNPVEETEAERVAKARGAEEIEAERAAEATKREMKILQGLQYLIKELGAARARAERSAEELKILQGLRDLIKEAGAARARAERSAEENTEAGEEPMVITQRLQERLQDLIKRMKEERSVEGRGRKSPAEEQVDGDNPLKRARTEDGEVKMGTEEDPGEEVERKIPERTPSPEPEDPENEQFRQGDRGRLD